MSEEIKKMLFMAMHLIVKASAVVNKKKFEELCNDKNHQRLIKLNMMSEHFDQFVMLALNLETPEEYPADVIAETYLEFWKGEDIDKLCPIMPPKKEVDRTQS